MSDNVLNSSLGSLGDHPKSYAIRDGKAIYNKVGQTEWWATFDQTISRIYPLGSARNPAWALVAEKSRIVYVAEKSRIVYLCNTTG